MNDFEIEGGPDQENAEIFQSNIRQIETTNRLLAHIEDKLNNLIYNKKTSPKSQKFSSFTKKNAENDHFQDKRDQDYQRGNNSLSENINPNDFYKGSKNSTDQTGSFFRQNPIMSQQRDDQQENYLNNSNIQNQAQMQSNSTRNIQKGQQFSHQNMANKNSQNQINYQIPGQINNGLISNKSNRSQTDYQHNQIAPNQYRVDDSNSNRNKFEELNYLLLGREDQDPSPSQHSLGNNQQIFGGTLEYTKSQHFNSSKKQQDVDHSELVSQKSRIHNNNDNKYINSDSYRIADKFRELNGMSMRSPQNQQLFQKQTPQNMPSVNEETLVQRIERMDKFYENKIKILSERVSILENENQTLIEQKSDLNLEIIKLKQNLPLSATNSSFTNQKFSVHEKNEKRDQERKIIRLEQQVQEFNLQNANLEREKKVLVDSLQHEIQELKNQNYKLVDENTNLRSEFKDKSTGNLSMRKQGSSNSLINYYKGNHQPSSQTSRNNYLYEDSHHQVNTIENTANIIEDIRNKYNIPRVGDKRSKSPIEQIEEEMVPTRLYPNKVMQSSDSQMTLNELQQKHNTNQRVDSSNTNTKKQKAQSEIIGLNYLPQQQQKSSTENNGSHQFQSQMIQQHQVNQSNPQYQDNKMMSENSYGYYEDQSTRRNLTNNHPQADNMRDEISKLKDELVRQKVDNLNMVQKISDFKSQNGINYQSQNSNQNHQSAPTQTEAQLMMENYKLYASQLEKSYEKIEQLYQRDVHDKQQRIDQLQQQTNLKKQDLEEEQSYILKPKLKSTKTRKTSVNKKTAKTTNSITTLQNIGRSKSVINTSKKL